MSAVLTVRRKSRTISLTALIDVVFILLMFFMLTSSFSRFGFFEFQTQGATSSASAEGESQVLVLLADGQLMDRSVTPQRLMDDQTLLQQMDASRALSVLPVGDANVQTMVQAIERLNRMGLTRVTLGQVLPGNAD